MAHDRRPVASQSEYNDESNLTSLPAEAKSPSGTDGVPLDVLSDMRTILHNFDHDNNQGTPRAKLDQSLHRLRRFMAHIDLDVANHPHTNRHGGGPPFQQRQRLDGSQELPWGAASGAMTTRPPPPTATAGTSGSSFGRTRRQNTPGKLPTTPMQPVGRGCGEGISSSVPVACVSLDLSDFGGSRREKRKGGAEVG